MDAPSDLAGTLLAGAGVVVGTTAAGAGLGAVFGPPCAAGDPKGLCGPGWNATIGGALGLVASGVVGLGIAALSPSWRNVGLTAAGLVGGLIVVGGVQNALAPAKPPQTTP